MVRNLHGEPLLYLRTFCKILHNPVDLGQANDIAVGDVRDVGFSNYGYKMVLAVGIKSNVLFHQHFMIAVLVVEQGNLGLVLRVQPTEYLLYVHFCDPFWRAAQAVVGQVEAHGEHNFPEMVLDLSHFFLIGKIEGILAQGRFEGGHDVIVSKVVISQRKGIVEVIGGVAHVAEKVKSR